MFQNTFGAEHGSVVFAIELDLLGRVYLTESDRALDLFALAVGGLFRCRNTHWQSRQNLIIYWQVFGDVMMSNLVIRTLYHLVLVKLFNALEAERVTTRQRDGLLVVVIVRLKANAALEYLFLYLLLHF